MNGFEWRRPSGGFVIDSAHPDRFHAHGPDDMAACSPGHGLNASVEEANEGSDLCPACMELVRLTGPLDHRNTR